MRVSGEVVKPADPSDRLFAFSTKVQTPLFIKATDLYWHEKVVDRNNGYLATILAQLVRVITRNGTYRTARLYSKDAFEVRRDNMGWFSSACETN